MPRHSDPRATGTVTLQPSSELLTSPRSEIFTGQSATYTSSSTSFTTFVNAYNGGKMIGFASYVSPPSSSVVGSHAYAVVGYNATNQTVTLFNPWGIQHGLLTLSWSQIQANFQYFDRTV